MNNLKELRLKRKLTQKMLAEHLKMSKQALSRLERGERELTETGIKFICKTMKVTPNDLIKW